MREAQVYYGTAHTSPCRVSDNSPDSWKRPPFVQTVARAQGLGYKSIEGWTVSNMVGRVEWAIQTAVATLT